MSVSEEQIETLRRKIINAFADVPYPQSAIALHECDECRRLRKTFAGEDWKTIDRKILEENYSKLPLFSSEAYYYFLPAYLVYSLDNFNDNLVCQFTIYSVSPTKKDVKGMLDYWQDKFENFTFEQLNLIYDFLKLVESENSEDFNNYRKYAETGRKILKEFVEPNLKNKKL